MGAEDVLKPCPFCGGEARLEWHSAPDCWVECNTCGAVGPSDANTTTEQNVAAWNSRASDADRGREAAIAAMKLKLGGMFKGQMLADLSAELVDVTLAALLPTDASGRAEG